ncbi:histidine--tRNA ligase [Cohnella sp. AR92]|uniref:histidine--tRNA ligase n=1 Tax=Cohnella sp. AR92 TaxID=648716 RepID=UPI000F8E3343|nr:histidine--tRNA ligase [Cohnella sp. AR92]RUS48844.1 histidine--tRNA ligase [Cohnella sp. AR92]
MQNVKGTYDFFGDEQELRTAVQSTLREVFELYGFRGMDTAILNELELLTAKYAGGDEIQKEIYKLSDQGERRLGLRYDLTIPFSKVVAWNPGIELPFRRYEFGKVFRDGPVKRGRLREFLQCDVDVTGAPGEETEAELMLLAAEAFKRLNIPITIKWNNRLFLGELLNRMGVPDSETSSVMLTLDKLEKIGPENVLGELGEKGIGGSTIEAIGRLLGARERPTFEQAAASYDLETSLGARQVRSLQNLLSQVGLNETCEFDLFLSRGLSFYTGTVYEIFDATGSFSSSLGGGGRYDAIIGKLAGREDLDYPTVGLSFGMESIMAHLRERESALQRQPAAPLAAVIPIGVSATADALRTAALLRAEGIRASLDTSGRKLKRSLGSASAAGARFAILIGEEEREQGKVLLKDMANQTERLADVEEAIYIVSKYM